MGSDPTKAESFKVAEGVFELYRDLAEQEGAKVWRVKALHTGATRNKVRFTREELMQAARSLSLRPLNINHPLLRQHEKARWLPYPDNAVIRAQFEDNAIEALIYVKDPEVNKMIEIGEINAVSVEWQAIKELVVDGIEPEGVILPALALLTKDVPPGDPLANIVLNETTEPAVKTSTEAKGAESTAPIGGVAVIEDARTQIEESEVAVESRVEDERRPANRILYEKWRRDRGRV